MSVMALDSGVEGRSKSYVLQISTFHPSLFPPQTLRTNRTEEGNGGWRGGVPSGVVCPVHYSRILLAFSAAVAEGIMLPLLGESRTSLVMSF